MEAQKREIKILRRKLKKLVITPISLPNDVVEEIFMRLPFKALIRLKSLSKQWRSTIESRSFAERHLKIAELNHSKVMLISEHNPSNKLRPREETDIGFRTMSLESSSFISFISFNFLPGFNHFVYASASCKGLFIIYSPYLESIYVVNPATRWSRQLPPARFQISMHKFYKNGEFWNATNSLCDLAFVKADDYKLVWLYNSETCNVDPTIPNQGVTKCDVFDFRTNAWRILSSTPNYRLYYDQNPAYANESVYWFTEPYDGIIKVVVFYIHTETFRLLPNIMPHIAASDPRRIDMCVLDNLLCMSKKEEDTLIQHIWKLNPSENTWEKYFTIALLSCSSFGCRFEDGLNWIDNEVIEPSIPVAICKNKKILLNHCYSYGLVKYDPLAKKLQSIYFNPSCYTKVIYFESLISHI